MSLINNYQNYTARQEAAKSETFGFAYLSQEERYVHPFQIYGPVWYVGDSWVCVHLIDTGDGLLLIDSGNCGAQAMLVQSIWEAGFNPADVRWIVHSHGHMDHIGAARFFRTLFGTKLYLSEPDARMYREHPERSFIQDTHDDFDLLFEPDVEMNEGDILTFGNITMPVYMVPGHTEGCIATFFDVDGPEGLKRCGYYGGFGFNTLRSGYLTQIGDEEFHMRDVYLESLAKVRDQKVDIFLGNHCNNNDTLEKRQKQIDASDGPNPFIDETAWQIYLDSKRDELLTFIKNGN